MFKLCDKHGYTFAFDLYAGKKDVDNGLVLATNVVLKLAQLYLDAGRTLSTDNFYTSLPLARALLHQKTHSVGTLRANRKGLPETVCKKINKRGIVSQQSKDGIIMLKWHDKRMYTS